MKFRLIEEFLIEGKNLDITIDQYLPKFKEVEAKNPIITKYNHFLADKDYRNCILDILKTDPTYKDGGSTTGTYGIWLLNQLIKNDAFRELVASGAFKYELETLLSEFENKKTQLSNKDINSYKSVQEVKDALADAKLSSRQKERANRTSSSMIKKVWENENWDVYTPINYAGSLTLGKGTSWCTADSRTAAFYVQYASGEYDTSNEYKSLKDVETHDSECIPDMLSSMELSSVKDIYQQYSEDAVICMPDREYDDEYFALNPYDNYLENFEEHLYIFINKKDKVKYQFYIDDFNLIIADARDNILDLDNFVNSNKDTIPFFTEYLGLNVEMDDENNIVDNVYFHYYY